MCLESQSSHPITGLQSVVRDTVLLSRLSSYSRRCDNAWKKVRSASLDRSVIFHHFWYLRTSFWSHFLSPIVLMRFCVNLQAETTGRQTFGVAWCLMPWGVAKLSDEQLDEELKASGQIRTRGKLLSPSSVRNQPTSNSHQSWEGATLGQPENCRGWDLRQVQQYLHIDVPAASHPQHPQYPDLGPL